MTGVRGSFRLERRSFTPSRVVQWKPSLGARSVRSSTIFKRFLSCSQGVSFILDSRPTGAEALYEEIFLSIAEIGKTLADSDMDACPFLNSNDLDTAIGHNIRRHDVSEATF